MFLVVLHRSEPFTQAYYKNNLNKTLQPDRRKKFPKFFFLNQKYQKYPVKLKKKFKKNLKSKIFQIMKWFYQLVYCISEISAFQILCCLDATYSGKKY